MSALSDEEEAQRFADLVDAIEFAKDVDAKVAALNRLEADLPSFLTLTDPERLIHTLKPLLRHPHAQLTNAALNFCHAFLPLLRGQGQHHGARAAIVSLMPSILDRLGDAKERTRESAARALEELGKVAIDCTAGGLSASVGGSGSGSSHRGKDQDTPLALFEKYAREAGLLSKSAKIREQVCRVLPHLRSHNAKFPLKPFLSPLVDLLSDADPFCREGSKSALIALFSKAQPGAKADLKKELERKNIRKAMADMILKEVLGASSPQNATPVMEHLLLAHDDHGSLPSSLPTTRPGTSMAATAAASEDSVHPVYIASKFDLDRTFSGMLPPFEGKETEHNWQARENAIIKVRGMLRANAYEDFGSPFAAAIKTLQEGILKAVASLRTTLATQGITLIAELAARLGDDLDSCVDAFVPALLKMAGFTKKIVATSSQNAVKQIFQNVSYRHRFIELLWSFMADKTVSTRVAMAEHLHTLLTTHAQHRKHALESHDGVAVIEKILRKGLADQHPEVRAKTREAFFTFQAHWSARSAVLLESLDSTARKQLSAGAGSAARGHASAAPSPAKTTVRSAAEPLRRPGGPSSAILAAKRAASARMAKERREGSGDTDVDERHPPLPTTPRLPLAANNAVSATPRSRPGSIVKPKPVSVTASPAPSSIPLPISPPTSVTSLPRAHASTSTSIDSLSPEQARPRTASIASSHSSGGASRGSAHSHSHSPTMSRLATSERARNFSGPSPGAGSTESSARSLKARSVADFASLKRDAPLFRPTQGGSTGPHRSRFAAPLNPDDTVQLGQGSSSASDATFDLMGNTSALGSQYDGDDSLTFSGPMRSLGKAVATGRPHADEELPDETIADISADQNGSTPRPSSVSILNGSTASDAPILNAPGLAFRTPQVTRPSAQAGAGWFKDRAERLEAAPISPFKSKPDALEWVWEIRSGKADVKVFRQVAKLCSQFRISEAGGADDGPEMRLEPGKASADSLGSTAGRKNIMHAEANGLDNSEGDTISQQTEAWRDGQLFDQLWDSLKCFLLHNSNSPTTDQITAALILLHKLIEYEYPLFVSFGLEEDLLEVILRVRKEKQHLPLASSSCEAIMDSWASKTNPALGLDNLSSTVRTLGTSVKVQTLGLRGVSKVIPRLPSEVIEDEMSKPALKTWITECFTDAGNVELRQAAVQVLVCAHFKVQDPEVVFGIVGPLKQDQKDLLTYYFSR